MRSNARLKYLVHTLGIDNFRTLTEKYLGQPIEPWRPLPEWKYAEGPWPRCLTASLPPCRRYCFPRCLPYRLTASPPHRLTACLTAYITAVVTAVVTACVRYLDWM